CVCPTIVMSSEKKTSRSDENLESVLIEELRQLRRDARRLNSSLVDRLKPFQKSDGSFKTLPDSKKSQRRKRTPDISVASTCTVLMAAILAGKHESRNKLFDKQTSAEVFKQSAAKATWGSSGLKDGNAFTTSIVIRSAGFLVQAEIIPAKEVQALKHA